MDTSALATIGIGFMENEKDDHKIAQSLVRKYHFMKYFYIFFFLRKKLLFEFKKN